MSENRSDTLVAFLFGAALGAGIALLLAPASGEETRRKLTEKAKNLGNDVQEKFTEAKEQVFHRADDVRAAVTAGRDAYRRSRSTDEPAPTSTAM